MASLQRRSAIRLAAGLLLALATIGTGPARAAEAPQAPAEGLHDRPVLVLDPGRHTALIRRLDADREGRFLVTASDDKTVRVWAAADGSLLRTLRLPAGPGHVGKAYAAAISPDGTLIAAGGWTSATGTNEDIYLFDRASGRLRHRVGGLPNVVLHLAFSPDGSRLAATLYSGGVRLIDPGSGWVVAEDTDYGDQSYGAAFDEAGRLATTSFDGKLRLYDPALRLLRTAPAPVGKRPFGLAFSPDGKRLAVGYDDSSRVDVLDGATLQHLLTPDSKGVDNGNFYGIAWSADGASFYAAGQWQVGGEYRLRRWPEGGRGVPVDVALSRNTVMSLRPLPGGRLGFAAQDPRVGLLGGDGREAWSVGPAGADFRGPDAVLAVSADGARVRFGYEVWGNSPALFGLAERRLVPEGSAEGLATARTAAPGLALEGWKDSTEPTLNGKRLMLRAYETARSLAIAPDGRHFVLGADFRLRLFDRVGTKGWERQVPGVAWAVAVSGDGRLVVAAYADGTIRWHRLTDGEELLAFYPLEDRTNWVAWTPDGFYAATPGAYGVLRWHVNHGRDEAAESIPVSEIPKLRRPDVLPLVLQEMDIVRALGLADLAEARRAVQARTGSSVPPGAQLHVLAIGVSNYNEEHAKQLRLQYADRDAWDIASALLNTQTSLYADVKPQILRDGEATRAGIIDGLDAMRKGMAAGSGRDLAVVNFSGHGAVVDNKLYLLPYDVDSRTPARIRGSAISAEELRDELAELGKLGRVLVLLDACHSGAATDGTDLAADATLLRTALAASNVTVLTSSSGKEVSREDPAWGHGAFTHAFLEALGSGADTSRDSLVSVDELMAFLGSRVAALTNGAQTPGVEVRYQGGLFAAGL